MQLLSIFPQLLSFGFFAPLLLRVVVSLFVLYLGYKRWGKQYKWASILYLLSGGLVFLGMYTQIAVIVAVATLKLDFYFDYWKDRKSVPIQNEKYFLYTMATVILLSLLLTGPGAFAFDLPL